MTIPPTKGPINRKNPLIRELDDGAICLNPVQQLSSPVQEDFLHPIGQKIPLTLGIRGNPSCIKPLWIIMTLTALLLANVESSMVEFALRLL